jgi:hypothetical protein
MKFWGRAIILTVSLDWKGYQRVFFVVVSGVTRVGDCVVGVFQSKKGYRGRGGRGRENNRVQGRAMILTVLHD